MDFLDDGLIIDDKNDWIAEDYPSAAERLSAEKGNVLTFDELMELAEEMKIPIGYFFLQERPRASALEVCCQWRKYLKKETQIEQLEKAVRLSIPILNDENDYIQIYVLEQPDGDFILSDDGETLSRTGVEVLPEILARYSVYMDGFELRKTSTKSTFNKDMIFFIQALISIPLIIQCMPR